jgi:hypothetical protein
MKYVYPNTNKGHILLTPGDISVETYTNGSTFEEEY